MWSRNQVFQVLCINTLNLVSRTKVTPKRRYIHSPKKGKPSKDRSRESSQSSHEDPAHTNYQKDDSASYPSEEFEVDTSNLPSRRSQRVRTRTKPYCTDPNDNEDSLSENEYNPPMKKFSGISNFQTPQAKQAQATTSTTQVEFATPYAEEIQGHTNVNLTTADPWEERSQHERAMTKENSTQRNSDAANTNCTKI